MHGTPPEKADGQYVDMHCTAASPAERNAAVVRRAVEEIWNLGDVDVADALFAPEYVNHDGLIPDLVRGPEAIKISVAMYRSAFPNMHVDVEGLIATGEEVALRWRACNASPDWVAGSSCTMSQSGLAGMTFGVLANGKIAESWTYWDQGSVLEQLGLRPLEAKPNTNRR
jgi:steroid delta-isomerase-like uncharacterized protein